MLVNQGYNFIKINSDDLIATTLNESCKNLLGRGRPIIMIFN